MYINTHTRTNIDPTSKHNESKNYTLEQSELQGIKMKLHILIDPATPFGFPCDKRQ